MFKDIILGIIEKRFGLSAIELLKLGFENHVKPTDNREDFEEQMVCDIIASIANGSIKSEHLSQKHARICLRLIRHVEKTGSTNGEGDKKVDELLNKLNYREFE